MLAARTQRGWSEVCLIHDCYERWAKPVRFEEIVILRFVDGKVVEQRGLPDNLAALRQLGGVPTPQPTSI